MWYGVQTKSCTEFCSSDTVFSNTVGFYNENISYEV